MSYSKTISAILKGNWLIDQAWAAAHAGMIIKTIKGEPVQWGDASEKMFDDDGPDHSIPQRKKIAGSQTEVFKVNPYTSMDRLPFDSIAMIDVTGPILKYGDVCTWGTVDYNETLIRVVNNKRVSGVIINFDTPGGQADGTAMFSKTIHEANKEKPVLGIVQDGICASGGMWLLSSCAEAYVTEDTDSVGSIGAYTTIVDVYKYYEKEGLPIRDIYAPQSVDKNKDYREAIADPPNDELIKASLKFLVDDFIKDVSTYRGQRLNTTKENPFTGKMYFAKEAQKIGLIDGIKSLSQVVARTQNLIALRNQNKNSNGN